MENQVVDVGIETAPAYRRKGYAQTALSSLVDHITNAGGEAIYICFSDNAASIATAKSVGFVPYGSSLIFAAPEHDLSVTTNKEMP
jgi:RimJ/RimL family protein N-acetyltransferase